MSAPKILVVANEVPLAESLGRSLERIGYEGVAVVTSEERAIQGIQTFCPDVFLVDFQGAGDLSGFQMVNLIRESSDAPIIFLTSNPDEHIFGEDKPPSLFGYLVKPVHDLELKTYIELACYKYDQERLLKNSVDRYRSVSELVSDFAYAFQVEPDGTAALEWVTDSFSRITGYRHMNSGIRWWIEIIHPADRRKAIKLLSLVMRGEESSGELRVITKSGDIRWLLVTNRLHRNLSAEHPHRVFGAAQDITERKQAEDALRWEASVNAALAELSGAMIDPAISIEEIANQTMDYAKQLTGKDQVAPTGLLNLASILSAPAIVGAIPLGEAAVEYSKDEYTERELKVIQRLTRMFAVTVQRRQAEREIQQRASQLTMLNDIGERIAAVLDLDSLLERAVKLVQQGFGYHHVAIFILDPGGQSVSMRSLAGAFSELFPRDHRLKLGVGVVGWAAQFGETVLANDVDTDGRYVNYYNEVIPTRSELSVAIRIGEEVVGVLDAQSPQRGAFSENDVMVLETLADQIAVAIHNARLHEAIQEEKNRARHYLDVAGTIIMALNQHAEISLINQAGCRTLGYQESELIGRNWFNVAIPHKDTSRVRMIFDSLMRGEIEPYTYGENSIQTKDGQIRIIAWHNTLLIDHDGNISGTLSSGEDITERKRVEEELRRERDLIARIAETSPVGILVVDRLGQINFANPRAAQVLRVSRSEITRRKYDAPEWRISDYGGDALPEQLMPFNRVIETCRPIFGMRHAISSPDGERVLLSVNAAPILDENGKVDNVVIMVEDITDQVRASEVLWESESRYRRLFEDSPIALWEGDFSAIKGYFDSLSDQGVSDISEYIKPHHDEIDMLIGMARVLDVNKAALKLYQAKNVLDLRANLPATFESKNRAFFLDGLVRFFADESIFESDATVITRKANKRLVQMKWSIPRGYENSWSRVLVSLVDITDRLLAEAEKNQLLNQVREIMNSVPEGVLLMDAQGRALVVNPAGAEALFVLAGLQAGDKISRLGDRVLNELLTSPPKGLWHEVNADSRIFEVIARPMTNGGDAEHWVMVLRDVTQERQIQEGAHRQERLAAVGQLAAGIAHDFNNILAVIVLYSELILASADLLPGTRERLVTISEQAQRAADLIQQILDFSRRSVLERRPMDVLPFLKEQTKLLERTLPEDIRIQLDYNPEEFVVNADPTRMQQALMNLAVNARDAMPKGGQLRISLFKSVTGGLVPCVSCGEVVSGEWVCITIDDSGSGIDLDILPHIFDPFFTTKDPGLGTGLGLSQVYGIIKQHEGHIGLRTTQGHGSTFYLYLPVMRVARERLIPVDSGELMRGSGEAILVVEDENASRQALVESLTLLGYDVFAVENGRQALEYLDLTSWDVDLVLSDVVMPEMGGIALFHTMHERGYSLPVVLMTGHPMQEELEKLQALGLTAWLLKPPRLNQIAQVIAQALA